MALGFLANVSSLDVHKKLSHGQSALGASFTKIAGTVPVNTVAESDPTGATSDATKAQMRPYLVAQSNAFDAVSMVNTANDALGNMSNLLGRMRALVKAGSDESLSFSDRGKLQREYSEVQSQLDAIKQSTSYNGADLLSADAQPVSFQVGPPGTSNHQLQVDFTEFEWTAPPVTSVGADDPASAQAALTSIDVAIRKVASERANLGAVSNQLDSIIQNIQTQRLNLTSTVSRIQDVSVAEEMASLTRSQLLRQPGVSVLAQASQLPQLSLNLLT